jgi:peroxiredoxin
MRIPSGAVLFVLLLIVSGCGPADQPSPEETTLTAVGQTAPSFEVTTLDGQVFNLEQERGRVVLVNFWATWCPPCREEIPRLEELWQQHAGDDFTMLAIAREETEDAVGPFVEAHAMSFPIACDVDRGVYRLYAEQYIPRNVVVDRSGTIVFQSSGYDSDEFAEMTAAIAEAMAAEPGPA